MKSIWPTTLLVVMVLLIVVPVNSLEARTVVRTGEYVSLGDEQEVEGNFYALGNTVSVSGTINGDLYAAAGSITLNGPVRDDVFFVGGTVALHASTSEDVRIIAGDVTIAESIGGSLAIFAGRVKILSTATIAGDVLVYGGTVTIEGKVEGQVLGSVDVLRLDGVVAGGVDVVSGALVLGDRADIAGDVRYESNTEIVRAPGAVVAGELIAIASAVESVPISAFKFQAIIFLILLFTSLTLFLLIRYPIERFMSLVTKRPLHYGLVGSATLLFLPVVVGVLLASILGGLIGLIVAGGLFASIIISLPLTAIFIGSILFRFLFKRQEVSLFSVALGVAVTSVLLAIPILGPGMILIAGFCIFGGLVIQGYNYFRVIRS